MSAYTPGFLINQKRGETLVGAVNMNSHHIGLGFAPISLVVEAMDSPKCPPGRRRTRLVVIRSKLQEPPNRGPPADVTTHCPSR